MSFYCVLLLAELDQETVLFDVCCGTGTIGLCLASKVKEVHGVDIIEEAIKDASANAEENGVKNATFHAGKNFLQFFDALYSLSFFSNLS